MMDENIPIGDTRYVFKNPNSEIYYINEEISHSKCHFSHSGSYTRIPYLQINGNYIKSPQIFFGL